MDSCTDRIEKLLNRAGQTISDIGNTVYLSENENLIDYATRSRGHAQDAVMHLTDIIDRLEWALDKTLREKSYLSAKCCYLCGLCEYKKHVEQLEDECEQREYCMEVDEDWREDDADI